MNWPAGSHARQAHLRAAVISREGGELTPAAVIARNLTREVEIFVPLGVVLGVGLGADSGGRLALLGWLLCISALPLFNRDHLRAGDLIGGTLVISMPRRTLLDDLTDGEPAPGRYAFSAAQLAVYGTFELQVLEELLRRPEIGDENTLVEACAQNPSQNRLEGRSAPVGGAPFSCRVLRRSAGRTGTRPG